MGWKGWVRVWSVGFGVSGLKLEIWLSFGGGGLSCLVLGSRVQGSVLGPWDSGVQGFRSGVLGVGCRVQVSGSGVQGVGCGIQGSPGASLSRS